MLKDEARVCWCGGQVKAMCQEESVQVQEQVGGPEVQAVEGVIKYWYMRSGV